MFSYTLMAAGLTRMTKVSFALWDKNGLREDGSESHSFQYIPVFVSRARPRLQLLGQEQTLIVATAVVRLRFPLHGCHRGADGSRGPLRS